MDQHIVLPSGRVLQTDDIIYVGTPKENKGLFTNYAAYMNVMWASRATITLRYKTMRDANHDYEILKKVLLGTYEWKNCEGSTMICS
jgi:hypothetical protein